MAKDGTNSMGGHSIANSGSPKIGSASSDTRSGSNGRAPTTPAAKPASGGNVKRPS